MCLHYSRYYETKAYRERILGWNSGSFTHSPHRVDGGAASPCCTAHTHSNLYYSKYLFCGKHKTTRALRKIVCIQCSVECKVDSMAVVKNRTEWKTKSTLISNYKWSCLPHAHARRVTLKQEGNSLPLRPPWPPIVEESRKKNYTRGNEWHFNRTFTSFCHNSIRSLLSQHIHSLKQSHAVDTNTVLRKHSKVSYLSI